MKTVSHMTTPLVDNFVLLVFQDIAHFGATGEDSGDELPGDFALLFLREGLVPLL